MHIYALKIYDFKKIDIDCLIRYISSKKMRRIYKFQNNEDKVRGILSELLIRRTIMDKFKINNDDIIFDFNKYGKPYLRGNKEIQFNLSHSGEYVVCCLDNKSVGIDVEKIMPIEIKGLTENFLSLSEKKYIFSGKTTEEKLNRFYEIWTLRESFVKCIGKGLSISLSEFYIHIDINGKKQIKSKIFDKNYFINSILIDSQYMMSFCLSHDIGIENVNYINQDNLISTFK